MMKTTFKTLLIVIGIGLFSGASHTSAKQTDAQFEQAKYKNSFECHYGQCNATAKSTGRRCLHCVSNPGDLYCYQH
jgi:hypothetical protein